MNGIQLSKLYYERFGAEMIHKEFGKYENRIAAGIAGPGSDCFGFDDETSHDHDTGAGFCLFLTDEDYEKIGFSLSRAYTALPDEIDGYKKLKETPYGSSHFGVKKISDFYLPLTGTPGAPETGLQWLYTPESSLAAAVNGEVFRDDLGAFTAIRNKIQSGMPEDVRLKKIAARVISMAQSGQYNFERCLKHGETGAAALAIDEFAKSTMSLIYLLNGKYAPFYKWVFRGARELTLFADIAEKTEKLVTEKTDPGQTESIEEICGVFADYFRVNGLSASPENFLEPHAYEIRDKIRNPELRNMHIMEG